MPTRTAPGASHRSWTQRLRQIVGGGGGPPAQGAADTPRVDDTATAIGYAAVTLLRDTQAAGVVTGPWLERRGEAIAAAVARGDAAAAQGLLDTLRLEIAGARELRAQLGRIPDPAGMTNEETATVQSLRLIVAEQLQAGEIAEAADSLELLVRATAMAEMRTDLGVERMAEMVQRDAQAVGAPVGATPSELKAIDDARKAVLAALGTPPTADTVQAARALLQPLRKAAEAVVRRLAVVQADPRASFERLQMRVADIVDFPPADRSRAIDRICQEVARGNAEARDRLAELDAAAPGSDAQAQARRSAGTAVTELAARVERATRPLREHALALHRYYQRLKALKPRLAGAEKLPEKRDDDSDSIYAAERRAYDVAKAAVIQAQKARDFALANTKLDGLVTATDALLGVLQTYFDGQIGAAKGAGNKAQQSAAACKIVQDYPGRLALLKPAQQAELLELMQDTPANAALRKKLLAKCSMDPAFVKKETENRRAITKSLRGDEATPEGRAQKQAWQEAEANWSSWASENPERALAFAREVARRQLDQMVRLAGFDGIDALPERYRAEPVLIQFSKKVDKDTFAETWPGFPGRIDLNAKHPALKDFKEMMDTVLHENTHSWQGMIVKIMRTEDGFTQADKDRILAADSPLAVQAKLIYHNELNYTLDDDGYQTQPVEDQAWHNGAKLSQALLVPPPTRSAVSGRGRGKRLLKLATLTRSKQALARTAERHGIYGPTLDGVRAQDQRLVLQGVPGRGAGSVTLLEVVDEFTLKLDIDTRAMPGRRIPHDTVQQTLAALLARHHKGKALKDLGDKEREALARKLGEAHKCEVSGNLADQSLVLHEKDWVDTERAMLVHDETVEDLA